MLEVAKKYGLRASVLNAFVAAQVGGAAMGKFPVKRSGKRHRWGFAFREARMKG